MAGAGGSGVLLAVVGPSGAGKDSVIDFARKALADDARVLFVRRTISRPTDGASEDHEPATPEAFQRLANAGAFAVTWQAHGLHYGLPRAALNHVEEGGVAIANGSRKAMAAVFERFPRVQVVEIAAAPDVIAERLAARGRETEADIAARLKRSVNAYQGADDAITLDNSGPLSVAGNAFVQLVQRHLAAGSVTRSALTKSG